MPAPNFTRTVEPANLRVLATGLAFPEGPVAMEDGSVVLTEIAAGRITRVHPDGTTEEVAEPGGGPNGLAVGPDGGLFVTNNGGCFDWHDLMGLTFPGSPPPASYPGHGSLQHVDLATGEVTTLVTACEGNPLRAPNDLVFDAGGGIWFTDHGVRLDRTSDRTGFYWCEADGSGIVEVAILDAPNGIGLSPDGSRVYVAETHTGRLWGWNVDGPGQVSGSGLLAPKGAELIGDPGGGVLFDSLAVDGEGWICVATLGTTPGITAFAPDGSECEHFPTTDPLTTNICFGGEDGRTAFVTLSGTGQLIAFDWPREGGVLQFDE
jgi:gluconolactonase